MQINKVGQMSVHQFIEQAANGGDLLSGFFSQKRALRGTRGHQKVQKDRGELYQKELTLKKTFYHKDFSLTLEGRIDGLYPHGKIWVIEEIKTIEGDFPETWEDTPILHRSQIICYGAMWNQDESFLYLELCYLQLQSGIIKRFRKKYSKKEVSKLFQTYLDRYFLDQESRNDWLIQRDKVSEEITFPFGDFRFGQRKFSVEVYRTIREGSILFCQAPTGVGKTMASLFPAIKGWGEGITQKILYLTAKTSGRESVRRAMEILKDKGLRAKTVILTAKDKICASPESIRCSGKECLYAQGYFNKLESLKEIFYERDLWAREQFEELAEQYKICPFELSLEWGLKADLLVGDYNHLFDPLVSLKRFFNTDEPISLLLDEAHNLPERGRSIFSANLDKGEILRVRREVKGKDTTLDKVLNRLNSQMLDLKKQYQDDGDHLIEEIPPNINLTLRRLMELGEVLVKDPRGAGESASFFFKCRLFLQISEIMGKGHRILWRKHGKKMELKLLCLDPSEYLKQGLNRCKGSILFSATLEPLPYFKQALLDDQNLPDCRIGSPFPQENCLVLLRSDLDTRYRGREASMAGVLEAIYTLWKNYPGNQMAFFPSYSYMEQAADRWRLLYDDAIVVQQRNMSEDQKKEILLDLEKGPSRLLFVVLGGIFSEGIDLQGQLLIGLSVVSVGFPPMSYEVELLKEYYDNKGGKGLDYACRYPGWNRVLQAAGRLIRSSSDRGIIQLIGSRFSHNFYRSLRLEHWSNLRVLHSEKEQSEAISDFRRSHD